MNEERVTAGDAIVAVAGEDLEAARLLGDLMVYSARSLEGTFEQLYLGEKNAHDNTRQRLAEANRRINLMERRILWLFGHDLESDLP